MYAYWNWSNVYELEWSYVQFHTKQWLKVHLNYRITYTPLVTDLENLQE
jgi:hypothetical protein